jgi:geranylgeranyl diphosphate synthase type II
MLENWLRMIEEKLMEFLPKEESLPCRLPEAMRYSVLSRGKRIRPRVVMGSAHLVGGDPERVLPFACGVEMIHTYSLIHDDLPAMDNDDFRRGQATSHRVFGEAMAILAGDALLTDAFSLMSDPKTGFKPEAVLRALNLLAKALGSQGMVGGQAVDIEVANKPISEDLVRWVHLHKTALFLKSSALMGAILYEADERSLSLLEDFGEAFGMAFQLVDDILDYHKPERVNLAKVIGLQRATEEALELLDRSIRAIEPFGSRNEPLKQIVLIIRKQLENV